MLNGGRAQALAVCKHLGGRVIVIYCVPDLLHRLATPISTKRLGETFIPRRVNHVHSNIMGDKSPKSVNKKATQKQSRADAANQAKKQAEIAKSAAGKNR